MTPNITLNFTATTPEAATALLGGLRTLFQPGDMTTVNGAPAPAAPLPVAAAPVPTQAPISVTQPSPVSAPAAPVQTQLPTTAPVYTVDMLSVAATPLLDAGRGNELVALLQRFGVQALTQLPPEQYGAFATELRALGAKL